MKTRLLALLLLFTATLAAQEAPTPGDREPHSDSREPRDGSTLQDRQPQDDSRRHLLFESLNGLTWQEVYDEVMGTDDSEEHEQTAEMIEVLQQLADNPIDLNSASRDDLEQLPFLSAQQVADIEEYVYRYGPVLTMSELRMIRSLDYTQLALLPYFTAVNHTIGDTTTERFPRLSSIARYGRHTLTATGRVPLYERKGDHNGYLGYRYRHSLRYDFSYGQRVKAGFIAAQDAGEPFFSGGNAWGYDVYSYYIQVKDLGRLKNAVLGKYKLSAGMGLVLNASFSLGKQATLQNLGRQTLALRPHSSRSEASYFQGAAATVSLSKPLSLTLFASYRPIDATLNTDNSAATLVTSGYHRTPAEMLKKHNTHMTATGTQLQYHNGGWRAAVAAVYTHLDRPLHPNRNTLYRRHYAHGRDFINASLSYGYRHPSFTIAGETAIDRNAHLATINTASYHPSSLLSIVAVQRFYSYRYTSLYGNSFSEGSGVQNESGIYLGATWKPLPYTTLLAYADYAHFPWARYLVSQTSDAWDLFLQTDYRRRRWQLTGRARVHLRQRDNSTKTALTANNDYRARLSVTYTPPSKLWTMKTQADLCRAFYIVPSKGWMVSQHFTYSPRQWQLNLMAAYFNTDNYQSRLYVYEHQLAHEFSSPAYYGRGMRLLVQARADITDHWRLTLRAGHTKHFDRNTVGTGLQQINHSYQSDIDLQLRYRF